MHSASHTISHFTSNLFAYKQGGGGYRALHARSLTHGFLFSNTPFSIFFIKSHKLTAGGRKLSVEGRKLTSASHKLSAEGRKLAHESRKLTAGGRKLAVGGRKLSTGGRKFTSAYRKSNDEGRKLPVNSFNLSITPTLSLINPYSLT